MRRAAWYSPTSPLLNPGQAVPVPTETIGRGPAPVDPALSPEESTCPRSLVAVH